MKKITFAVLGAALVAASALATEPATKARSGKIICRTEPANGSRLAKTRACHTSAEWAELRRQQKDNIDNILNRRAARISDDPPGAPMSGN